MALVRYRLHVLHATGAVIRCGVFVYAWGLPGDEEACNAVAGPQERLGGPHTTEEQQTLRAQTYAQIDSDILQRLEKGSCGIRDLANACGFSLFPTRKRAMLLLQQGKVTRTDAQVSKSRKVPMIWSLAR
jgi:hypothetical protein